LWATTEGDEMNEQLSAYQQRALQQSEEWVNGKSVHNIVDDECCPDFSCCTPTLFEGNRFVRLIEHNQYRERLGLAPKVDA
jgi:hypothetical protein